MIDQIIGVQKKEHQKHRVIVIYDFKKLCHRAIVLTDVLQSFKLVQNEAMKNISKLAYVYDLDPGRGLGHFTRTNQLVKEFRR